MHQGRRGSVTSVFSTKSSIFCQKSALFTGKKRTNIFKNENDYDFFGKKQKSVWILKKNGVSKNVRRGRELKKAAAGLHTGNNPPGIISRRFIYKQEDK